MPITVECDTCKSPYTVDAKFVGRMVTCKSCGKIFKIQPAPANAPPAISDLEGDPFENARFERPSKPKVPPPKKFHNPIETNSLSDLAAEDAPPPMVDRNAVAGPSHRGALSLAAATPYILGLLVIASIVFGVIWTIQIKLKTPDPKAVQSALSLLWVAVIIFNVLFFAVVAPLMLAGVWGASRILKFKLVDSAYLRICGVCAPAMLAIAAYELDGISGPFVILLFLLVPAAYFILKFTLGVDWAGAGLALGLGGVGFAIGCLIMIFAVHLTVPSSTTSPVRMAFYAPVPDSQTTTGENGDVPAKPPKQRPTSPSLPPDDMPDPLMTPQNTTAHVPPPAVDSSIHIVPMDGSMPDWTTVASLSGGKKLAEEISYKQFKLRLPKEMRLDLRSSEENPGGLVWNGTTSPGARLSIHTQPRGNLTQMFPVVTAADPQAAEQNGLLVISRSNVTVSRGQINDAVFTKIETSPGAPGEHFTQLIAPFNNEWLFVEFSTLDNGPFTKLLSAAARTVRQATGEEQADPFAPKWMAARLADNYDVAVARLRSAGPAAEDALAAQLTSKDESLRQSVLTILKDLATEKSLPALRRAALDPNPLIAGLAREGIVRLRPNEVVEAPAATPGVPAVGNPAKPPDDTTILADLDSSEPARRKAAVTWLPTTTPDEKQRAAVTSRLMAMLRAGDAVVPRMDMAAALAVWGDAKIIPDVLPLLDRNADVDARHAAMRLLSNFKDARAAARIAQWIVLDPVPTADALIAMGPVAEDAAIALLREPSAPVRIDAARILSQIGTRKCIAELTKLSHDVRDAAVRGAAVSALETVKTRVEAEKPGK